MQPHRGQDVGKCRMESGTHEADHGPPSVGHLVALNSLFLLQTSTLPSPDYRKKKAENISDLQGTQG